MGCQTNNLYIISFSAGGDSGLALVSAASERMAEQVLRNSGRYNGTPDRYKIIQIRNIGLSTDLRTELLMESFINALVAFDVIDSSIKRLIGPKGDPGPDGPPGPPGPDGASLVGVEQTHTASEDEGSNEITFTLSNGTTAKIYIKNGRAGVTEAEATVDSTYGTPSVATNIEDGLLSFSFSGLKGPQGNPGMNNTRMQIVDELPEASDETEQDVYLVYNDDTGDYDRYITVYDGEDYEWVQAGSLTINLADYRRKDDDVWLTQAEFDALEVKDITKVYNIYEESDTP